MGRERLVIAGVSTRALAEAASAAGWECSSVDGFGDLDQKALVDNIGLGRDLGLPYSPTAVVRAARRLHAPCAAYTGNLENHPASVARLARGRELLGNPPATLVRARDFVELRRVVRAAGGRVPLSYLPGETRARPAGRPFLRKPLRGGGGQGIRELPAGARIARHELAQELIAGVPASVSFLADGRRARLLGVARGLNGEPRFGAAGYRYCGNLFPLAVPASVLDRLEAIVQAATRSFGLVGLNGIDFILRGDEPFVLELNPRHSASMELMQRAFLQDLFALHADACRGGLPAKLPPLPAGVWGKAILWAHQALVAPDTRSWLGRDDVRDVPFPGEEIPAGAPICTVLGQAAHARACLALLENRAAALARALRRAPGLRQGQHAAVRR
jgi:predicted ATP-grasp superfamily ATP-dependent carboligase